MEVHEPQCNPNWVTLQRSSNPVIPIFAYLFLQHCCKGPKRAKESISQPAAATFWVTWHFSIPPTHLFSKRMFFTSFLFTAVDLRESRWKLRSNVVHFSTLKPREHEQPNGSMRFQMPVCAFLLVAALFSTLLRNVSTIAEKDCANAQESFRSGTSKSTKGCVKLCAILR